MVDGIRIVRPHLELAFRVMLLGAFGLVCSSCGSHGDKISDQANAAKSASPAAAIQPAPNQQNFPSLTADQWINLSQSYFREGKYLESIAAAQTALYLKPDLAEAYNNIGAAYAALRLWDPAIQADQSALRLKPDFVLARNNLAWSLSQKQAGIK